MSDFNLVNQLSYLSEKLTNNIAYMKRAGIELASAEAAYKTKLMQEALKLRDEGMAVGMIDKVVYGVCAKERQKRDIAEAMYKTAQESINSIKLQIRITDSQLSREWSDTGKGC